MTFVRLIGRGCALSGRSSKISELHTSFLLCFLSSFMLFILIYYDCYDWKLWRRLNVGVWLCYVIAFSDLRVG